MSVKLLTGHNLEFKTSQEAAQARLSLHLLEFTCCGSYDIRPESVCAHMKTHWVLHTKSLCCLHQQGIMWL